MTKAAVPEWVLAFALKPKHEENQSAVESEPRRHLSIVTNSFDPLASQQEKYVRSGFLKELETLHVLAPGTQSDGLNKAAFKIGTLVGTGLLPRDEAESALLDCALSFTNQNGKERWNESNAVPQIRSGLDAGIQKPRSLPEPKKTVLLRGRGVRQHISGNANATDDEGDGAESSDEDERAIDDGIYAMLNGRTVLAVQKSKGKETGSEENTSRHFVADFAAYIDGEVRDENGVAVYEVIGKTKRGKNFTVELQASKMSDPKYVSGQFLNSSGAGTIVYAGMEKHLAPSVHQFTDYGELRTSRRFSRVGWTKDMKEFVIPGMEAPDMTITLDKELAYKVTPPRAGQTTLDAEVSEALHALLRAHRPELTTVALTHALLASFAPLAGWRDDKFALFIAGRTGSFKTSWAAQLMCVYGDFSNEDKLLKFGMGGTANAMMSFTADASDVPLLIDNFKPGTGGGQKAAQDLIHGVLEGGEKKRLNRDGTRRSGKEIHCWPIFTGEDTIDDAASVARMLILAAKWDKPDNEGLTHVQNMSHLLPAVGGAWLAWQLTDDAREVAKFVAAEFFPCRSKWAAFLRENAKDMVNANRVASSLALCECGWEAARACPALAPVLGSYTGAFNRALEEIARSMGSYTAQSHEANRYLAALRALLTTNRAYLANVHYNLDNEDRRPFLGWEDDNVVYLQPDAAYAEVMKFLRDGNGLNGLGMSTIHKQLDQLGHLARKSEDKYTYPKRVGPDGKLHRLLWVKRESIFGEDNEKKDGA
jgi:hypothetical protein